MNPPVQQSGSWPVTLHDWERVLTSALLHAHDGNEDAVRSFEITGERLAEFCGRAADQAAEAEEAFRRALVRDPHLNWCLQNGTFRTPGSEVPNCMAMLACSLLVDSLLDGVYEGTGAYRDKLRQWLGVDRSFMDLRGIATMWRELVAWLDSRAKAGAPFRRLILPEIPPSWTHIGYTRYMSFPTRRDIRFLRKQIEAQPKCANDPAALVRRLDPLIETGPVSHGLRLAFDDFRRALRSGKASADHRFWRLVGRAAALEGVETPLAELLMEFDEDGMRHFRARNVGASRGQTLSEIGRAAVLPNMLASPNIGPAIRRGVLFFHSSGLASWSASGDLPVGVGPFHVAIAEQHARLAAGTLARFAKSGTWLVTTDAVARSTMTDILARLGIRDTTQILRSVGLADGVHVGRAWLGLPRFLPRLEGATSAIEIRAVSNCSTATLSRQENRLKSDGPVEGEFILSDDEAGWSRRATFMPLAEIHGSLEGARYRLPLLEDCRPNRSTPIPQFSISRIEMDESAYPFQDALEALYASARSGINEGEAVAILARAAGRRTWELLRTLQETTFFDARLLERWRGRVFTLGLPTITVVPTDGGTTVVSGAMPMRLETDFLQTVALQGGRPFRQFTPDSIAPPLLGAIDVDPSALSQALGWKLEGAPLEPGGTVVGDLHETGVIGEFYEPASAWDWSLGRFRTGVRAEGPVALERLVHPGGRDHDIYRVEGSRLRTFHSRHAAIIEAHAQAGRPLFRYAEGVLRRLPLEGALPIEIAHALRLRSLLNGGAAELGWSYAATSRDASWLGELLPELIQGLPTDKASHAILSARRGRGARRAMWIGGEIAA